MLQTTKEATNCVYLVKRTEAQTDNAALGAEDFNREDIGTGMI